MYFLHPDEKNSSIWGKMVICKFCKMSADKRVSTYLPMLTLSWHFDWHLPTSKPVSWYVNVPLLLFLNFQIKPSGYAAVYVGTGSWFTFPPDFPVNFTPKQLDCVTDWLCKWSRDFSRKEKVDVVSMAFNLTICNEPVLRHMSTVYMIE